MSIQHELYGEILTAKEVTQATGFTMNQLRNWRVPARRELAPFGFISIGATPYYRKVVIQDYLDEHGVQQDVYVMSERDKKFPIAESQVKSLEQTLSHQTLSKITTETVNDWLNTLIDTRGLSASKVWMETFKEVEDALGLPRSVSGNGLRWENPTFWLPAVHTARLMTARDQELAISTEEVLALPVGDNPPTKETRFKN